VAGDCPEVETTFLTGNRQHQPGGNARTRLQARTRDRANHAVIVSLLASDPLESSESTPRMTLGAGQEVESMIDERTNAVYDRPTS
jgi:hypothetical protein